MDMDNQIYHLIKNIKKVSGFLGQKGNPLPVSEKEIQKIKGANGRWCSSTKIFYNLQYW